MLPRCCADDGSKPIIEVAVKVFPQPVSPTIPRVCPEEISRLMPRKGVLTTFPAAMKSTSRLLTFNTVLIDVKSLDRSDHATHLPKY